MIEAHVLGFALADLGLKVDAWWYRRIVSGAEMRQVDT